MRVLWFTNAFATKYYGYGWVSSLEEKVSPLVTLKVANVRPVDTRAARIKKLFFGFGAEDRYLCKKYLEAVEDFKPDIIQIFGSEHAFGLITGKVTCPVILHVQGIMGPYFKAYMPKGMSWASYILSAGNFGGAVGRLYTLRRWRHAVAREKKILGMVGNYLCRTEWDKAETLKAHPGARIFEGGEVLRREFYSKPAPAEKRDGKFTIVTTISEPPYKGMDLVLRAGKLLREGGYDFAWKVFGDVDPRYFERRTGISCDAAGITLCGVADAAMLAGELSACDLYVHPSYIDNSPNSVCEAQMMGAPVVAAACGGVPSLVEEGRTGFLFPAGDAPALVKLIERAIAKEIPDQVGNDGEVVGNDGKAVGNDWLPVSDIVRTARETALKRHDPERIVTELLKVYKELLSAALPA